MLENGRQEYSVFYPSGIREVTASVDAPSRWQILKYNGEKYALIEGEARNGIISKNIHELDSGILVYYVETTKEWIEKKKNLKKLGLNLDKIVHSGIEESNILSLFLKS